MSFTYKEVLVSGSRSDTEGASKFITEAKIFLESAGWTLVEDRTSQAGSATPSLTHKMVFSSNGEALNYPTYYLTVFSGSTSTPNSSMCTLLMSTAYDVVAHDVPASGVSTLVGNSQDTQAGLNTPSQADYQVWMSGDSEGVVFVTKQGSTYDSLGIGRYNSFVSTAQQPYPLFTHGSSTSTVVTSTTTSSRIIAGNPPQLAGGSRSTSDNIVLSAASQPYNLGATTSVFIALPIVLLVNLISPIRKGTVGTIRNSWGGAGSNAGMLNEARLTASGTFGTQTYRAFLVGTTASLLIRES